MSGNLPNDPNDLPEGKMEISIRVLGNELIGVKMLVDDMKMKWVVVGMGALALCLWAVATFAPAITGALGG